MNKDLFKSSVLICVIGILLLFSYKGYTQESTSFRFNKLSVYSENAVTSKLEVETTVDLYSIVSFDITSYKGSIYIDFPEDPININFTIDEIKPIESSEDTMMITTRNNDTGLPVDFIVKNKTISLFLNNNTKYFYTFSHNN